jgi:hypothetical protein
MDSLRSVSSMSRRQVLRGFTGLAASAFLSGCGADLYRTVAATAVGNQPTPSRPSTTAKLPNVQPVPTVQPVPAGTISATSMTVTAERVGSVAPGFLGFAFGKQALSTPLFSASATQLISLFKLLGPGVLRVGGASVDKTIWVPNSAGQTPGQIAPVDVAALAAFLQATGWTCIYGVNLGGAANGSTTPAMAAAEVACVSELLGDTLVGVELGNACESYGDPGSFYVYDWTIEKFESLWLGFRDAIVATTPAAPLVGPASASDIDTWTIPFGEYVTREKINLVTQHYFRSAADAAPTVNDLIAPDLNLSSQLLQLTYGSESIGVPFRIAECGSYGGGGVSGVSDAYASTLWAIDMIFNSAIGGATGVNFQAGGQTASTSIADTGGTVVGPQPAFYGLLLAAMAGAGSMLATQLVAGSLNVTGYAIQNPGGGMNLVIVNKDETQNLDMIISLPAAMKTGTLSVLGQLSTGATAPSLSALSGVNIQGASIGTDGSFTAADGYAVTPDGQQVTCYVPALSAVLIQVA